MNTVVVAIAETAFGLPSDKSKVSIETHPVFSPYWVSVLDGLDEYFHLDLICGVFVGTLCVY